MTRQLGLGKLGLLYGGPSCPRTLLKTYTDEDESHDELQEDFDHFFT